MSPTPPISHPPTRFCCHYFYSWEYILSFVIIHGKYMAFLSLIKKQQLKSPLILFLGIYFKLCYYLWKIYGFLFFNKKTKKIKCYSYRITQNQLFLFLGIYFKLCYYPWKIYVIFSLH